jgi:hypothetical protein
MKKAWLLLNLVVLLISAFNIVVVAQRPDALQFFGFWIVVAAAVGATGSIVALVLVAFRKLTADPHESSVHRLT